MTKITCPKCQHQEIENKHICSKCGARLVVEEGSSTLNFPALELNSTDSIQRESPPPKIKQPTGARICLVLLNSGAIIPLTGKDEFIIGRIGGKQTVYPDVDMSSYSAYTSGVSRLHAAIKERDGKFYIVDLGSTNGTWVNNMKLPPNKDFQLQNSDKMLLGRLNIMVIHNEDSS